MTYSDTTKTTPAFYEGDEVMLAPLHADQYPRKVFIDTVDVDGDYTRCRVRNPGSAVTHIVDVSRLMPYVMTLSRRGEGLDAAVQRGCEILDREQPGWADKINHESS